MLVLCTLPLLKTIQPQIWMRRYSDSHEWAVSRTLSVKQRTNTREFLLCFSFCFRGKQSVPNLEWYKAASLGAVICSQAVYAGSGKAEALAHSPFTKGKAAPSKEIELLDRKADSCLIPLPTGHTTGAGQRANRQNNFTEDYSMLGKYRTIDLKIHMKYFFNFYYFEYKLYYLSAHACHLFLYTYTCTTYSW